MSQLFDQLDRAEKADNDDRAAFLARTRRLSKKWVEEAKASIQGKNLSVEEEQAALWSYINNRDNGYEVEKKLNQKDSEAGDFSHLPKIVKRQGYQIRAHDSRRRDLMLQSASTGLQSGLRDAVTKNYAKSLRKKARAAVKLRKPFQRKSEISKQTDIREMLKKRFMRN